MKSWVCRFWDERIKVATVHPSKKKGLDLTPLSIAGFSSLPSFQIFPINFWWQISNLRLLQGIKVQSRNKTRQQEILEPLWLFNLPAPWCTPPEKEGFNRRPSQGKPMVNKPLARLIFPANILSLVDLFSFNYEWVLKTPKNKDRSVCPQFLWPSNSPKIKINKWKIDIPYPKLTAKTPLKIGLLPQEGNSFSKRPFTFMSFCYSKKNGFGSISWTPWPRFYLHLFQHAFFVPRKKEKTHDRSQKNKETWVPNINKIGMRDISRRGLGKKRAFHPSQYTFLHVPTVDSFDKTAGASQRVVVFVVTKPDYD